MRNTILATTLFVLGIGLLFYGCLPIPNQRLAKIYIDLGNDALKPGELNWDFNQFRTFDVNRDIDVNRAVTHFTAAVKINPDNSEAYVNRGFGYSLLNWAERACPDFQRACELGDCDGLTWSTKVGFCKNHIRINPIYTEVKLGMDTYRQNEAVTP